MKKRKMTFVLRKDRTAIPSNREAKVTMWRMNKDFLLPEEIELWEKEQDLKTLEFIPHDEYTKKFFNFIGEESLTIRQINEILRFNVDTVS